jgi:outer membrane protein OmpA-like peptidoglycan-associated protein
MVSSTLRKVSVPLFFAAVTLGGCTHYVKQADFDSAIADLRASDQKQQQQLDSLTQEMQQHFAKYDAQIAEMGGRVRVDTAAHFAFNDATVRDEDKPLLDDFAKVISSHYPGAMITVEGFADPAGSKRFNRRLGAQRAAAVRDYLVSTGGLSADRLRAVSYGEDTDRQVDRGQTREAGAPNRRVTLVVDFAGSAGNAGTPPASGAG